MGNKKIIVKWIFFLPLGYVALVASAYSAYILLTFLWRFLGNNLALKLMILPMVLCLPAMLLIGGACLARMVSPGDMPYFILIAIWGIWSINSIFLYSAPMPSIDQRIIDIAMPRFLYILFVVLNLLIISICGIIPAGTKRRSNTEDRA